jgi:hypothetical protein
MPRQGGLRTRPYPDPTIRHSPFAIRHSRFAIRGIFPFAIRHSPFAIRRLSPFAIPDSPFAVLFRSPLATRHSPLAVFPVPPPPLEKSVRLWQLWRAAHTDWQQARD